MKQTKKIRGQIMVIVLLILSVLSIIALTITLATVRDTQEQVQNKQYQQYYSMGERMILDIQRTLGNGALFSENINITSDATGNSIPGTCSVPSANKQSCDFTEVASSEITSDSSLEKFDVHVELEDSASITAQPIGQDQDLLLELPEDLSNTNTFTTVLEWNETNVDWNISYDFINTSANFETRKLVYTNGSDAATSHYTEVANNPADDSCFTINGEILPAAALKNKLTIEVKTGASKCAESVTPLYFRLKPVGASPVVNVTRNGSTIPLQRIIKVVTTSNSSDNTSNTENPTSVLETKYLLTKNPLALFDYVLRTEQGITKQ